MRHWITCFALVALGIVLAGCSDTKTPVEPTAAPNPVFTATLSPLQENPPIVAPNADAGASGTVKITLNVSRDANGNLTAATADFEVTLAGFPPGTTLTGAHIHQGTPGNNTAVVWNTGLATGTVTFPTGSGTFSRLSIPAPDLVIPQAIINGPAAFYFNVHTTVNTGGAVRNQLTRAN